MRLGRWIHETLAEWGWAHTGMGLLLGTLMLFNMGTLLFNLGNFHLPRAWFYNVCEFGLPGVLALRVADRAVADGVPRIVAYGLAVATVIVAGVWVVGPLLFPLVGGEPGWGPAQDVMLALNLLLPLGLATVAYAQWRSGADTLQRLNAAQVGRAREEQTLQSARLLALQARVEPQFLFDTLNRVRDGIDPAGRATATAEQLLTDLIALLRAMQPAVGATASTVARELALVQAYARAAHTPALLPPRLLLQASPEAAQARLAPLLVLPALRSLAGDAPAGDWALHADTRPGRGEPRLHLRLLPRQPNWTTRVALNAIALGPLRERALAVHGDTARISLDGEAQPSLLFDLPLQHEPHPSPDR